MGKISSFETFSISAFVVEQLLINIKININKVDSEDLKFKFEPLLLSEFAKLNY